MPLVFVSYAHQDRDIALKLVERLRKAAPEGLEIVIDDAIDAETASIGSDAYRLPFVGKRLRNANAVVSVLTRTYAESDPCWLEMSAALMMEKVFPINLDPGLSPSGVNSMAPQRNVIAIAPAWFEKEPGEVEAAETAKFERFVRELTAEAGKHSPFSEWQPAEPRDVRPLTVALAESLRPRAFQRSGLVWSPGSISEVQKRRFFAAIASMSIATGDSSWDIARRKALKAMADAPNASRVRAEALMGLIGELTAPSDGSPVVTAHDPWEFVGDFALPIDRDISRFAYTRAGKVPNELRKMFQVLRPGRSKRRAMFAFGALLGGIVGAALTYGGHMLFGAPGAKPAPPPPEPTDAPSPPTTAPALPPVLAPPALPPPVVTPPAPGPSVSIQSAPPAPPPPVSQPSSTLLAPDLAQTPPPGTFVVSGRGLEATVRAELGRRNLDEDTWREVYGEVISLNINTLCSPDRWKAAESIGRKPLDLIHAETQLTWPTDIDFVKAPRYQECPVVYRVPT
jgi:hypothetical protein